MFGARALLRSEKTTNFLSSQWSVEVKEFLKNELKSSLGGVTRRQFYVFSK